MLAEESGQATESERVDPGFVRALFDRIAPVYDPMNLLISFGLNHRWKRATVRLAGTATPGARVLDLCCGSGDLALISARLVGPGGRVVGLDFSPRMLEVFRRRLARLSREGKGAVLAPVELVMGDATDLSAFPEASFNLITIGFGLRNLADPEACLRESLRVLRPGGAMSILDLSKPVHPLIYPGYLVHMWVVLPILSTLTTGSPKNYLWLVRSLGRFPDREGLKRMMESVGFVKVSVHPLAGGVAAIHVGRKPG